VKAVGYVRVSTEEQASSIESQKTLIEQFCKLKGFELVRIFEDIGISGATPLIYRPGFVSLLEFCERENIRIIVVTQMDRLTRNEEDDYFIKQELVIRKGFTIYSILDLTEISLQKLLQQDPTAELAHDVVKLARKYERRQIAARTRKGFAQKKPLGHKYNSLRSICESSGRDVSEVAREIVVKVCSLFRQGYSMRRIAEETNLSQKFVRFILWLAGLWTVPTNTCPKCGSKRLRKESDVFYVCEECGFLRPLDRSYLFMLLDNNIEFLYARYPRYFIELLKAVKELNISTPHVSERVSQAQTT